jgi:DNA invertase Pin-like site-specific DNA recombinase
MIYGYIRISSDKQTVENQRFEIDSLCKKQNIKVDKWIEEDWSRKKDTGIIGEKSFVFCNW